MNIIKIAILSIIICLSTSYIAAQKNIEAYDIFSYIGKNKALAYIDSFSKRSDSIYQNYLQQANIPYGLSQRETFDYFSNPAYNKADGVFIFIHGGYWQSGNKEDYAFIGKWLLENNIDFILIEYDLTKENELNGKNLSRATMTAISGEIASALDHIQTYLNSNNRVDSETPVFLCGHSAGGHLASLYKEHPVVNTAVFSISGLFDLAPLAQTKAVGEALQLNEKEIINLSPIKNIKKAILNSPAIYLYYGEDEMPELISQSKDYYDEIKKNGYKTSIFNIKDADHFEILNKLFLNSSSPLINEIKKHKRTFK
ncbi:MAG: alpha/beta hydrolase [Tannerellaceae bacterium]